MPRTYKDMDKSDKGDPNIMKLKEVNKIRPLDNVVAGWRQHGIEHPSDPEQFASVVCPGPRSCPLCRKPVNQQGEPHFPVSRRFAANVWDYDTNSIKVLVAGPMVFDEFKTAAQVGIDPATCDWTITKTGQGRGTEYKVIRHDVSPFTAQEVTPEDLHSVDKYEQPASAETIFEILDRFGIDYDSLTIPSYTYEQALEFRFPYTKHKGETVEQVLDADESFAEWLHGTKLEQGQLGDPVFLALQTAMEERGLVPALDDALAQLPEPEESPVEHTPTVNQSSSDISVGSANMVKLVGPDEKEVMVPPSAVEAMLKAGFKEPEPEPKAEAASPMQVEIGGKIVELPPEQAQALIDTGTAKLVQDTPAEPEPPKLPLPDEEVTIEIGGTGVQMPFIQAAPLVDAGTATFADVSLGEAFKASKELAGSDPSPQQSTSSPSTSLEDQKSESGSRPADPEKPFRCDQCEAAYKTQGALTNHKNKVHKAAAPQPSSVPASQDGGGGNVEQRVKELVVRAPFARDYQKLIQIFEEETGISDFAAMTEEQLLKVEKRIEKEIVEAA